MINPAKTVVVLLSTALVFNLTASAQTAAGPKASVMLKVDVDGTTETKHDGGSGGGNGRNFKAGKATTTQKRSLKIAVTNPSNRDLGEVTVQYWLFADDKESGQVACVSKAEKKVNLGPGKKEIVTTEPVTMTSVGTHLENKKTVKASGQKFLGCGVQVMVGSDIAGEFFDPKEMKTKTNLDAVNPGSDKKDAAKPAAKKEKKQA